MPAKVDGVEDDADGAFCCMTKRLTWAEDRDRGFRIIEPIAIPVRGFALKIPI
jgi:hypothetical protein